MQKENNIKQYLTSKLEKYKKPVVGIGVSAFTRTGPAFLIPNYSIICLLETADLDSIRKKCTVHQLKEYFGINPSELKKNNTFRIIKQAQVSSFLENLEKKASLLVYKSTKKVEKITNKLNINILASPSYIRDQFENKRKFRMLTKQAGINLIPGENILIKNFSKQKFLNAQKKYGKKLVFQLPDYTIGGGIGTIFAQNTKDWNYFHSFVKRRIKDGKKLKSVNITKFMKGIDASISACVTQHGVLCGLVQTQLIDIPEAKAFKGRNGVWCGHDWGWKRFDSKIQKKAESIAQKWGNLMQKKGYRGVFGLDLIVNEEKAEVWPVECNSRYTGGFPAYSMMQELYNEPSFDTFHLLEFLKIDYKVDLKKVQKMYHQPKNGAHIVLRNQTRKWVKVQGSLKGGIYKLIKGKLVWQRQGFAIQQLKNNEEFCLVDRAPIKGTILKPGERLVRILFKDKIALSSHQLNSKASKICKKVYKEYNLKIISSQEK